MQYWYYVILLQYGAEGALALSATTMYQWAFQYNCTGTKTPSVTELSRNSGAKFRWSVLSTEHIKLILKFYSVCVLTG